MHWTVAISTGNPCRKMELVSFNLGGKRDRGSKSLLPIRTNVMGKNRFTQSFRAFAPGNQRLS
jgi:hypothetical protein